MVKRFSKRLSLVLILLCLWVGLSSITLAGQPTIYIEFPQGSAYFSNLPVLNYLLDDVETLTTQFPAEIDPDHQCLDDNGGQTEGTYTVWIPISIPAGSVYLSTLGSNYNTIMTMYRYTPNVENLTVIACNDDFAPGSVNAAYIAEIVPTGQYIFQISSVTAGAQANLDLVINLEMNAGVIPTYDFPSGGINILNANAKAVKAPNAHLLSILDGYDSDANALAPCQMYNTAWFTFTPAFDGAYNFNSSNSRLSYWNNDAYTDTVLQVVREDLSFAPEPCADGAHFGQAFGVPLLGGVTCQMPPAQDWWLATGGEVLTSSPSHMAE